MFFETLTGIKADVQRSHTLALWKCQHANAPPLTFPSYCVALLQDDAFIKHHGSQRPSCVQICKCMCDCITSAGSQF